jgi:2-dehydro-3-deoxyphosphogluconate aldolase / (4S)-4-hydroxy-2-oxoglutarate aldolase
MTRPCVPPGLTSGGVVAVARRLAPAGVASIADALVEGGVHAFELTLDDPEDAALEALAAAARHTGTMGDHTLEVGAGTVLSIEAAGRALDAGATFLVSPHVDTELVRWASDRGVPILPGAATPTEVLAAWRAGAAAVKVFPASMLGPRFLRELQGPFPRIPLQPTGGITVESAGDYIRAGAIAIGMGSWLFAGGTPASIADRARQATDAVAAAPIRVLIGRRAEGPAGAPSGPATRRTRRSTRATRRPAARPGRRADPPLDPPTSHLVLWWIVCTQE